MLFNKVATAYQSLMAAHCNQVPLMHCCTALLQAQLIKYKSKPQEIGISPSAVAATQAAGVEPETFWADISHSCAELSKVARMLLSIPPASATSERVFSAVCQVWDTGRSRSSFRSRGARGRWR
jgi:hypothetical protein